MDDLGAKGNAWFGLLSIVPPEYHYIIRMISWFFITLALTPIVPLVILILYDLLLWIWRLCVYRPALPRDDETDTRIAAQNDQSGKS